MAEKFVLGAVDYAILGLMLVLYVATSFYFRMFGGPQKTMDEYLLAGRNMSIFPVSLSMMATFMSGVTIMGTPADTYMFGICMALMSVGFIVAPIVSSIVFVPVYFTNGVFTSYEYLEKRFGTSTRRILSAIFLFRYLLFNGIMLYAPALALNAITDLSVWGSIITIGIVCTFYSTLGGMKTILWTDVFQTLMMFVCVFVVIVHGCIKLGGPGEIIKSATDGGRISWPTCKMNLARRRGRFAFLYSERAPN